MMTKRVSCLIISATFVIALFGLVAYKCTNEKIQPAYCQELYKELNRTSEQFRCSVITADNNGESIQFVFNLTDIDEYDRQTCTDDMIRIRDQVSVYLANHPHNDLVEKCISLQFQSRPGDVATISNFSNQKDGLYNDFPFCLDIRIPISEYESFINVFSLSIEITNKADLALLGNFKHLEYLNLIGPELTEEEIKYVKDLLNGCVIVYNGSKI